MTLVQAFDFVVKVYNSSPLILRALWTDQFHLIHSEKAEHRITSPIAVHSNSNYLLIKHDAPHSSSVNS